MANQLGVGVESLSTVWQSCIIYFDGVERSIGRDKEFGAIIMFLFLMVVLMLYIAYRIFSSIYVRIKTANK